eukprot:sb/3472527/
MSKRILDWLNKRRPSNLSLIKAFVGTSLGVHLFTHRVLTTASVTGRSMAPTYNANSSVSLLLVDLVTPVTKIQPGEIVLVYDPEEADGYIVKRVKALAGQFVEHDMENPGEFLAKHSYEGKYSVPTGYCWIEGDNTKDSADSRKFGPVPLGLIQGRILCKLLGS